MWRQGYLRGSGRSVLNPSGVWTGSICSGRDRRYHCTCIFRARGTFCSIRINLRIFHLHVRIHGCRQCRSSIDVQSSTVEVAAAFNFSDFERGSRRRQKRVSLFNQAIALFGQYSGHTWCEHTRYQRTGGGHPLPWGPRCHTYIPILKEGPKGEGKGRITQSFTNKTPNP